MEEDQGQKMVIDQHDELWDVMQAAGTAYLRELRTSEVISILEIHQMVKDDDDTDLVEAALRDELTRPTRKDDLPPTLRQALYVFPEEQ